MRATNLLCLLSGLSMIAACSSAPSDEASESQGAAVSSTTPALVTVATSSRGGFTVTSVNTSATSHVGTIDYSATGLDADTTGALAALPATELVLEGTVRSGTFVATTAYRGMPGMTFDSSATFYEASGTTAHALNESTTRKFSSIDVTAASAPFVQQSWLSNEVAKGALVAGEVTQGARVLTAKQVFIALPFVGGPCVVTGHVCPDATPVNTFTRDANLCLDFAGCEAHGACSQIVPGCSTGYMLESWTYGPQACPQFACDPSFIHGVE
jgi:hypothetical protein